MSEVIVVTSGKGGVGKTTTSANVGTGLAMMGAKVVLIDTDIGLRNLDVVMGLENRIVYNLVDVVEGNCRIKQALIKDKRYPNLFLLPSAQTKDKSAVTPGQMRKLVDDLREEFDYVLLDCPAGIEQGFKNAIAGADRAFVVTTPEVSAIRDADRIIGLLEAEGIVKIDLIVNRIRMDMVRRGDMMSIEDVTDIRGGTIAVIGDRRNNHSHAARSIALVLDLLVIDAADFAGSLGDGALDIVVRHIVGLRLGNDVTQLAIDSRIAAAVTDRNRDLTTDFGKDFAARCVRFALFMLDIRPLRMARHKLKPPG